MEAHQLKCLSKAVQILMILPKKSSGSSIPSVKLLFLLLWKRKHLTLDYQSLNFSKPLRMEVFSNWNLILETSKMPLFVKLIPVTQDSIAKKTIYIRDIDDDGKFTDEYIPVTVKNDSELSVIYRNAKGLICLNGPKKLIISFDEIKDGEKYQVFRYSQDFSGWQQNEAEAMEAETLRSMIAFLKEKFQALPINLSTDFFDEKGKQIQEWDGVLLSKDALYLLEAKHVMTVENIKTIAERVIQFPKMIERYPQKEFVDVKYSKIVGVACGTLFPIDCRKEAHRLGLMVMYPSGSRYGLDEKYIIE